jgi:hypothetical protein
VSRAAYSVDGVAPAEAARTFDAHDVALILGGAQPGSVAGANENDAEAGVRPSQHRRSGARHVGSVIPEKPAVPDGLVVVAR